MSNANILNIQRFSLHDGPGIRTTVFLKGCNLRCWWCHNPESQEFFTQITYYASKCIGCGACVSVCPAGKQGRTARFTADCTACGDCAQVCFADALILEGREMTEDALFDAIMRDESIYHRSGGGVTFSGGEPLLQHEMLGKLLPRLHRAGIHTAVETASNVAWESFERIVPYVDLFMCDIKLMDSARHRQHTGVGNERILENLRRLAQSGAVMILRTPVIPGVNDTPADIGAIAAFVAQLGGETQYPLELLPYHNLGADKFRALGLPFYGDGLCAPSEALMRTLVQTAQGCGIVCEAK